MESASSTRTIQDEVGSDSQDSLWDLSYVKSSLDTITQLNDIDSLNDPEDLPFKSKYAAREHLEELRKRLKTLIESQFSEAPVSSHSEEASPPTSCDDAAEVSPENINLELDISMLNMSHNNTQADDVLNSSTGTKTCVVSNFDRLEIFLRYIEGKLGLNYVECEETSSGEEHLSQALKSLTSKYDFTSPAAVHVYKFLLNQLGILHATRRSTEKAADALHKAEKVYDNYKANHSEAPSFPTDLLAPFKGTSDENNESSKWMLFESEHTQTLFYLAQVYQKSDDSAKASHYCQLTLRRQLQMKKYDPVEWALNAATLSQYYMLERDFSLARHCLASSMKIFEELGAVDKNLEEGSLYSKSIDIKRCWVKYGLELLEVSWIRLLAEDGEDGSTTANTGEDEKNADFFDLELTKYEQWMPSKYLLDFDQARSVFLKVQELIVEAKEMYGIDSFCSDYVELIQDHSRAFKNLSVFEANSERRSKMHKRRADMLEEVTAELNPQFYLLVWRQLVYETAEVYSAMVDCKADIMSELNQRPSQQAVTKLNSLCQKSIHKYLEYIGSLKTPEGTLPEPLPPGDERPVLVAWFCVARLYYKMIMPGMSQQIECVQKTLLYYKLVVDSCDKNSGYAQLMEAELPVCREMVNLLPVKLNKMIAQMQSGFE